MSCMLFNVVVYHTIIKLKRNVNTLKCFPFYCYKENIFLKIPRYHVVRGLPDKLNINKNKQGETKGMWGDNAQDDTAMKKLLQKSGKVWVIWVKLQQLARLSQWHLALQLLSLTVFSLWLLFLFLLLNWGLPAELYWVHTDTSWIYL